MHLGDQVRHFFVHIFAPSFLSSSVVVFPFVSRWCSSAPDELRLLLPLLVLSPLRCPLKRVTTSSSVAPGIFSQNLELRKMTHLFRDCNDHKIGMNRPVPGRPFVQMQTHCIEKKNSTSGQDTRRVLLSPPFPLVRRPVQILSQSTFQFENSVLHQFAPLPNSGKLFRTSDTRWKSSSS